MFDFSLEEHRCPQLTVALLLLRLADAAPAFGQFKHQT